MKHSILIFAGIALMTISITSCNSTEQKETNTTEQTAPSATDQSAEKAEYTCPMHPDVISDKEGDCPKCGMKLEKK